VSAQRDPELDELFLSEPDLRELAELLRSTPHPAAHVEPSPQFRVALRRRLMREAWEQASRPRVPWHHRLLAPRPLAALGAAVGVMLISVTILTLVTAPKGPHTTVTVVSPQNESDAVSEVTPIQLEFNQPMDTHSVQDAVNIQPATQVRYSWQDNNTRLTITPVHSLAPNTQYQVTVGQEAMTTSHQNLTKPARVSFVTVSPTPTPSPHPSTQPTSTPLGSLVNVHPLAPVGAPANVRWAPDGSHLFVVGPSGQLQSWPLQGAATPIAPEGVTVLAVDSNGVPAYVHDGQITYGPLAVSGVAPIALGFRASSLVFATASDVQTSDQQRLATLSEAATAAAFSPAGDRLAYRGASGLHVVDLGTHRDTLIGPAAALGDWLPDGRHYAYATDTGVWVTDGVSTTRLVDDAGVTGLTWSHGNQVLLSTATGLQLMNGDGSQLRTLESGSYAQPLWAPGGSGVLAFRSGGQVWTAKLPSSLITVTPVTPGLTQDDLVSAFMAARKAQFPDPESFLDEAGKDAFSRVTLVYSEPSLSLARSYVLLSQPGRVVVRLVLSKGSGQQALDETLLVQPDSGGHPWIHGVTETPRTSFGGGPEVLRVAVTGRQVQVFFDSDLVPGTVQSGVTLKQGGTSVITLPPTYDSTQRLVTLTVPVGLSPGTTYDLVLNSSLQDVGQRFAIPYDLQVVGPQPPSSP
jgi:hypothetical protein